MISHRLSLALCIAVIVAFNSCEHLTGIASIADGVPLPPLKISWSQDNSVVCFGTSLTYGYRYYGLVVVPPHGVIENVNAQPIPDYFKQYLTTLSTLDANVDSSYPYYLKSRLKIKVFNEGYVGAKISRALQLVDDSVLSKKPALVLLEFGANDFLQGIDTITAESQMDTLVQKILNYGSAVVLLSFFNPDMINQVPPDYPLLSEKDLAFA